MSPIIHMIEMVGILVVVGERFKKDDDCSVEGDFQLLMIWFSYGDGPNFE